jgi:hypothetical protein
MCISLLCLLVASNGCITAATIDRAQGNALRDPKGLQTAVSEPNPKLYWFLFLTIPADMCLMMVGALSQGGCYR